MRRYFYTLQLLLKNPRLVADPFVDDQPSDFAHPFRMLIYSVVISVALLLPGFVIADFPAFRTDGILESEITRLIGVWICSVDFKAFTWLLPLYMAALLIPALSIAGLFFYREVLPGFYRNLILNCYLMNLVVLAQIVLIPVWIVAGAHYTEPAIYRYLPALTAGSLLLRSYQLYFRPTKALMWVRILSVIATGYIIFVFISGFINSFAGYLAFAVNRIAETAF